MPHFFCSLSKDSFEAKSSDESESKISPASASVTASTAAASESTESSSEVAVSVSVSGVTLDSVPLPRALAAALVSCALQWRSRQAMGFVVAAVKQLAAQTVNSSHSFRLFPPFLDSYPDEAMLILSVLPLYPPCF